ncbi:MAG: NUDIX domain-containing protein [Patescibacteria group bacterium]
MIREKSAGVIVFRLHPKEGLQYLVLYHRGSYWNFPKGKLDAGESEEQGAKRELVEETGIKDIKLIDGWRAQTDFFFKEARSGKAQLIKKDFILFLAKLPLQAELKISGEHNGYAWLNLKTANKYLRFKNLKGILAEADSFVNARINEYRQSLKK